MTDLAYYLTFGRMPTLGLDAWQAIYRSYQADGVSRVVLWTGGGFRSRRHPVTWQYNRTHRNIEQDFLGDLIDYGHTLGIKTLLGFVPYDYDGINQFPIEQPRLRAIGADGNYLESQGIHCWGYALNPALDESRRLVLDYVKELYDDFYPQADGILIESSDLKLGSGSGDYFSLEYDLVRELSEDYWKGHADGELIIYPHYFRADRGQTHAYDPRWQFVFTSHSAELEPGLIQQASYSYYADYSLMVGGPEDVRTSCRLVRDHGISSYFPPFEFFTYRPPQADMREPHLIGRPLRPFGFEHLSRHDNPYEDPLVAVNRHAVRAFLADPDLPLDDFLSSLGPSLLGPAARPSDVEDLLSLHRLYFRSKSYFSAGPAADPRMLHHLLTNGQAGPEDLSWISEQLASLPDLRSRLAGSPEPGAAALADRADDLLATWTPAELDFVHAHLG
jgi:hypothetical protein